MEKAPRQKTGQQKGQHTFPLSACLHYPIPHHQQAQVKWKVTSQEDGLPGKWNFMVSALVG